jgi:exodeoxyribonuclease V alpha subunit
MVLGDICGQGDSGGYSPEQCTLIQEVAGISLDPEDGPPIADQVAVLHRSYRFGGDSGIGAAARALNAGDGEAALSVLADKSIGDASIAPVVGEDLKDFLGSWIVERMSSCLSAGDTSAVLAAFNRFRILCAVRGGARGVLEINRLCELRLEEAGLIGRGRGGNYAGRPLMVTTNAYGLGLFNGDVGMLLADTAGDGSLRACFETGDEVRRFPVPRLPAHESVYAMTVHKSQGSEFDEVLLILPDKESRVLSRELLYTGITRARRRVTLLGDPERIREAANRPVVRSSGLYDALWKR